MLWCGNCVSRISHRTSFFLTITLTDRQLLSFIQRMFFPTLPREIKLTPTWKGTLYILKSCYLEIWTAETILTAAVRDIWRLAIKSNLSQAWPPSKLKSSFWSGCSGRQTVKLQVSQRTDILQTLYRQPIPTYDNILHKKDFQTSSQHFPSCIFHLFPLTLSLSISDNSLTIFSISSQ